MYIEDQVIRLNQSVEFLRIDILLKLQIFALLQLTIQPLELVAIVIIDLRKILLKKLQYRNLIS